MRLTYIVTLLSQAHANVEQVDLGQCLSIFDYLWHFKVKLAAASLELAQYGGKALLDAMTNEDFCKFSLFNWFDSL